ncbi:MAG: Sensory/regulatory protein RpfC [Chloroflexi bacterium]|nr:Sensory/regulatory protein RpfC [Chloroflexota bacterium]
MNWQTPPLLIPLGIASAISAVLFFYINRRKRDLTGALPLMILQGLVFVWTMGHMLSWASADLELKVFSSHIQYIPAAAVPLLWLVFTAEYAGFKNHLSRPKIILAAAIPLTTILLKWSNEFHHLIWQEYTLAYVGPYTRNNITSYGAWFWVHTGYSYLLMVTGTGLLVYKYIKASGRHKKQARALLLGAAAPWITNFLYLTRMSPFGLNLTPFAFTLTGIAFTWGLLYYQTTDLAAITRRAIAESINDGLIVINNNDHLVDMNAIAEKYLGQSKDTLIGNTILKAIPQWEKLDKFPHEELEFKAENETHYYDVSISLITNKQGRKLGRAIVLRDITTRKLMEQEVTQALEKASTASQMKTRLIANVSHDLRSPMGAIIGYSEILQSGAFGEITANQKATITDILENGEELLNFINNLLGQSQLETGAFKPTPKSIPTERLFLGIQSSARSLARAKGVEIATDIKPTMPQTITGDIYWLNQIIINLISNAVKYTDQGYVKIWLEAENEDFWSINVEDTGTGLPKVVKMQLLEPGEQKDITWQDRLPKSGIGLNIVKQVAELMGGKMNFQSTANQGSAFTVTLPFTPKEG